MSISQIVNFKIECYQFSGFGSTICATCNRRDRSVLWNQIISFGNNLNEHWCIGGDFNIITYRSERKGGNSSDFNVMCEFNDMNLESQLMNTSFLGPNFT